ncbi:MAG: CPBP family intramembrane metalloprotease [Clostridia bacterium]|nr:CPBP family intramembrane metalloprotease [Clostridia bacterium]
MLESETAYPSNIWLVPLFVLIFAILPAFLEEILMRGIGVSATKRLGTLFTLFFSGFFFAFMHGTWIQIPFAFAVGLVLTYFTLRFNTIWIAVISHFIFNFNSVVQCLILQNGGEFADLCVIIWSALFSTLMIGLMVAGLIIYGVKRPNLPKSDLRMAQKMKILFSSPFLYVFILLEVYQLIYLLTIY